MVRPLSHDLRDAVRALLKQPRFTLAASLTLALGVGAVTSIFSVVNGVLLRPLPFPEADRLVNIWSNAPGLGYDQFPLSPDLYHFYRRRNTVFDRTAMFQGGRVNLTGEGAPEVVDTAVVTAGYFATLGVSLMHGRGFREDEDLPNAPRVVVVSHRYWMRRFAGDPSLVGRTLRLDGEPSEVIGITPGWLDSTGSPDLFLPTRLDPDNPPTGTFGWFALARLKPGVSENASGFRMTLEAGKDYYFFQDLFSGTLKSRTGLSRHTKELVMYELDGAYWAVWARK